MRRKPLIIKSPQNHYTVKSQRSLSEPLNIVHKRTYLRDNKIYFSNSDKLDLSDKTNTVKVYDSHYNALHDYLYYNERYINKFLSSYFNIKEEHIHSFRDFVKNRNIILDNGKIIQGEALLKSTTREAEAQATVSNNVDNAESKSWLSMVGI